MHTISKFCRLLDIQDPMVYETCIGHSERKPTCWNPVAEDTRLDAARLLRELRNIWNRDGLTPSIRSRLEVLSGLIHCARDHQSQAPAVAQKWIRRLEDALATSPETQSNRGGGPQLQDRAGPASRWTAINLAASTSHAATQPQAFSLHQPTTPSPVRRSFEHRMIAATASSPIASRSVRRDIAHLPLIDVYESDDDSNNSDASSSLDESIPDHIFFGDPAPYSREHTSPFTPSTRSYTPSPSPSLVSPFSTGRPPSRETDDREMRQMVNEMMAMVPGASVVECFEIILSKRGIYSEAVEELLTRFEERSQRTAMDSTSTPSSPSNGLSCGICSSEIDLQTGVDTLWRCQTCNQIVHRECFDHWIAKQLSCSPPRATGCIYCRAPYHQQTPPATPATPANTPDGNTNIPSPLLPFHIYWLHRTTSPISPRDVTMEDARPLDSK